MHCPSGYQCKRMDYMEWCCRGLYHMCHSCVPHTMSGLGGCHSWPPSWLKPRLRRLLASPLPFCTRSPGKTPGLTCRSAQPQTKAYLLTVCSSHCCCVQPGTHVLPNSSICKCTTHTDQHLLCASPVRKQCILPIAD